MHLRIYLSFIQAELLLMKLLSHVVWSEGMFLSPLHFQTQSRHFEDSIAFLVGALWGEPWGLSYFALDTEAIRNGRVALTEASGIFPDALPFDLPSSDPLPPSRELAELFTPTDDALLFCLSLPRRTANAQLFDLEGNAPSLRYSVAGQAMRDDTNGIDERELLFGRKNLRIIAQAEITPELLTMPLARVLRDGRGGFVFDPEFIPACLRIGASETLMLLTKRLIESLEDRIGTLARGAHRRGKFEAGSSALDVANYWFLHALSTALPVLRHLHAGKHSHPSQLFLELSRLAGSLTTFAADSDPATLPRYVHADPGPSFRALDVHIRRHLEIVVPTNFVSLQFTPSSPQIHEADVSDERCLRRARWIFGIRSTLGEADLIQLTQRLVKICSARFVPELVRRALPGMTLLHLPVPPSAIRAEADKQYFSLELSGPCWDHIQGTRRVGVYVPGEILNPEFDLSILVEPVQ